MNPKLSWFVIHVKAIIYLLLYNLHDCTFKFGMYHLFTPKQKLLKTASVNCYIEVMDLLKIVVS